MEEHQYGRRKRGNNNGNDDDSSHHSSSAKRFRTTNNSNEETFSYCNGRLKQNISDEPHIHHADNVHPSFVPEVLHRRESNPVTTNCHTYNCPQQYHFSQNSANCDDMTSKISRVNGDIPDHTLLVQRMASDGSYKYLPDMDASENPYYYENNRLLFELYIERVRRSSHNQVHPQSSHHF